MFKTRKTLEIEYDPTSQQLAQLKDTVKLVKNLIEVLEDEREEVVYFMDNEYSISHIRGAFCLLNDMLEERYSHNILEQ